MNCNSLHDFEGLQFMPVRANKMPILKNWQAESGKHDMSNCEAVGLVCGELSGGVEVLDCDVKYSLDGQLFNAYKRLVHAADNTLLDKLVVQSTKSGGYHLIYRCKKIQGNLKLANRHTTDAEKQDTYDKTYQNELKSGKSDEEAARKRALRAAQNDKVRVLLETRGLGGYIVCEPSEGYKIIHRDLYGISEITPEQRDLLHSCARQMNEYFEEVASPQPKSSSKSKGITPLDDYDKRGDVVALLQDHGWRIVPRASKGNKTMFLRPGQTTAATSGNFDASLNWFSVFTTSSDFEPEKAYKPSSVFAVLECNKNYSEAARKLYDLGYGERHEEKTKPESTRQIKSRVDPDDDDLSFLAKPEDYDPYLQQVIDGTLVMGLSTGSPTLDKHYLFKAAQFVMTNGIDNTGKSVWTWWLLLLAAMYHGWTGIIFSSENTLGAFMRKMIQFYWGKPLHGERAMSKEQFDVAKAFVEKHFKLIKAQEDLYNYKDIINMVKKARKVHRLDYAMVDPYNSLKIDLSGFSKLSTHEYHYEALSEMKAYGQQNNFGWYINHHAVTAAARAKDGEKKYPLAPNKADTEGGQKVANKADDFLTIHRITQHPTDWMVTEVHVRKIKDTETGGRPTPLEDPVKFEMYRNGCAFIERVEGFGLQIDPVIEWHRKNNTFVQETYTVSRNINSDIQTWSPIKDDDEEAPF